MTQDQFLKKFQSDFKYLQAGIDDRSPVAVLFDRWSHRFQLSLEDIAETWHDTGYEAFVVWLRNNQYLDKDL
jgi:hypothetical protein